MQLGKELILELSRLKVEGSHPGDMEKLLLVGVREDSTGASAKVLDNSRLGSALHSLTVWSRPPESLNGTSITDQAAAIARQVTYLVESLTVLEHDRAGQRALLRSAPPRETADAVEYFEGWLTREASGTLSFSLHRYRHGNNDLSRQAVPIILTHEVLERLVDDLASILAGIPDA